jgi:CrcB protein
VVNVSGATILGLLTAVALPTSTALIAGTGSSASYTTFSTWMLETHRLSEQRQHRHAITNVAASIALGLAAAATGLALGAHL